MAPKDRTLVTITTTTDTTAKLVTTSRFAWGFTQHVHFEPHTGVINYAACGSELGVGYAITKRIVATCIGRGPHEYRRRRWWRWNTVLGTQGNKTGQAQYVFREKDRDP